MSWAGASHFPPFSTPTPKPKSPLSLTNSHLDNRIYPQATSFLPERWYSKRDELIKHKDAFAPFSMGPFGCIGKNLAYMQIRTLTARILLEFDVSFAPGEDGSRILTQTKDHFTVDPGQLDLVFTPRKG
jgi:cytochrome P450